MVQELADLLHETTFLSLLLFMMMMKVPLVLLFTEHLLLGWKLRQPIVVMVAMVVVEPDPLCRDLTHNAAEGLIGTTAVAGQYHVVAVRHFTAVESAFHSLLVVAAPAEGETEAELPLDVEVTIDRTETHETRRPGQSDPVNYVSF